MIKRIKIVIGVSLLAPVFAVGLSAAQGVGRNNSGRVNAQQPTTQTQNGEDPQQQLKERLEKRKAELKTRLTFAQQTRIKTRCKAAQGSVSSINGRIKGIETSRTEVYENLISRLTGLSEKLKNKGLDTAQLNTQIAELQAKIDVFKTDLETYKQAVSDLAAMDCAADPTAFQASLEAARTARQKVTTDSQAVKTYVKETIKATLAELRAQLDKPSGNEEAN